MSHQRYSQTAQTTNATPTVVLSVPIGMNSSADIKVEFSVLNSAYSNGAFGEARVLMRRASGNVARATGNGGLLSAAVNVIGDFLVVPGVDIVANTSTQTADITFTGLAGTTLNWVFSVNVKRNSP